MGRSWTTEGSEPGPDLPLFRVRFDHVRNPRTGAVLRRLVLGSGDWVNGTVFTEDGLVVMVRQHRFGTGRVTLEPPGGMVDEGEDHGEAIRRETLEETGFEALRWTYLGAVEPNPAIQDNLCHHWVAHGARRVREPRPDAGEDIEVCLMTPEAVAEAVRDGTIRHALAVTNLARVLPIWTPSPGRAVDPRDGRS